VVVSRADNSSMAFSAAAPKSAISLSSLAVDVAPNKKRCSVVASRAKAQPVVRNVVLNLTDRVMWWHIPDLWTMTALPFDYDEGAECPHWEAFLAQVLKAEDIFVLLEWFGYCLTAGVEFQKMLALLGPPRSGKSTIADILCKLIGAGNYAPMSASRWNSMSFPLERALVQIAVTSKTLPFAPWGPQAPSAAFHTSGAGWPRTSRRPSPNCPFRMRCSNSMPAIVIAAFLNRLKPSITAMRCFTPRWSCSIRLFRYFDERSLVFVGRQPSAFSSRTARCDAV
jgi:hypothetical protein